MYGCRPFIYVSHIPVEPLVVRLCSLALARAREIHIDADIRVHLVRGPIRIRDQTQVSTGIQGN